MLFDCNFWRLASGFSDFCVSDILDFQLLQQQMGSKTLGRFFSSQIKMVLETLLDQMVPPPLGSLADSGGDIWKLR